MQKEKVIMENDFPGMSWDEISKIIGDSKTDITFKNNTKIFYSNKIKNYVFPMLFLICILASILPAIEYTFFDDIWYFLLIFVNFCLLTFIGKEERVKPSWVILGGLIVVGLFLNGFHHGLIIFCGINLSIIWLLISLWDNWINTILRKKSLESESSFIEIWMNTIDQFTLENDTFTHKLTDRQLANEIEMAIKREETLASEKSILEQYDKAFAYRFGNYINPITQKPISGAQDYIEAKESSDNDKVVKFHDLTVAELNQLFYNRYHSKNSAVVDMKSFLLEYDRQNNNYEDTQEEPEQEEKGKEYYLEQLNSLIGMNNLKKDVSELISLVQMQQYRKEQGYKSMPVSLHLVFSGNPGTGKTSVARIIANIYREIGVLEKGQLVEVDRSDLVAGYIGQTAIKTKAKIDEAMGGILFIDEAYTLNRERDDFGQEAIDTVLKAMEDERDRFVVIAAGYPEQMVKFVNSNPGLKSRFSKTIYFPDYNEEELFEIFRKFCLDYDYSMTLEASDLIKNHIKMMVREKDNNFANARAIRNYFEKIVSNQAARVMNKRNVSEEEMMKITKADLG